MNGMVEFVKHKNVMNGIEKLKKEYGEINFRELKSTCAIAVLPIGLCLTAQFPQTLTKNNYVI